MLKRLRAYLWLRTAQYYFGQGKTADGLSLLRHLLSLVPNYHVAYFHMARQLGQIQLYDEAIVEIRKALTCTPHNSVYHTLLGKLLYEKGCYADAQEVLQHSLHIDPHNILTYNYLALCHLVQNDVVSYEKILRDKGVFESSEVHLHILLALERYRYQRREKNHELDHAKPAEQGV